MHYELRAPSTTALIFARRDFVERLHQNPAMSILDHINVKVSDADRSAEFYERALAPLGIRLLMRSASGIGFGVRRPQFWIHGTQATFPSPEQVRVITPVHVCFTAKSREDVDAFYKAAMSAGARDFGGPARGPSITQTATVRSCSTPTDTTSKRSTTPRRSKGVPMMMMTAMLFVSVLAANPKVAVVLGRSDHADRAILAAVKSKLAEGRELTDVTGIHVHATSPQGIIPELRTAPPNGLDAELTAEWQKLTAACEAQMGGKMTRENFPTVSGIAASCTRVRGQSFMATLYKHRGFVRVYSFSATAPQDALNGEGGELSLEIIDLKKNETCAASQKGLSAISPATALKLLERVEQGKCTKTPWNPNPPAPEIAKSASAELGAGRKDLEPVPPPAPCTGVVPASLSFDDESPFFAVTLPTRYAKSVASMKTGAAVRCQAKTWKVVGDESSFAGAELLQISVDCGGKLARVEMATVMMRGKVEDVASLRIISKLLKSFCSEK